MLSRIKFLFILILLSVIVGIFTNNSFASSDKKGYEIRITVKGLSDTTCRLVYHFGDKQYIKDSARADKKGTMIFKGENELPGGVYVLVLPDKRYFEFIVTEQNISLETDFEQLVTKMKVKNSEENKVFYEYLQFIYPKGQLIDSLKKEMDKVKDNKDSILQMDESALMRTEIFKKKINETALEVDKFKKELQKKHSNLFAGKLMKAMAEIEIPEAPKKADGTIDSFFKYNYYKEHFFDNIDFTDDRILRTPVFHQKLKQYIQTATVQIPDSINKAADFVIEKAKGNKELFRYCVWWITNTYETAQIMGMDAVFVHLALKYYNFEQAYWVDTPTMYKIRSRALTLQPILIGKVAPNLLMKDMNGQWRSLHSTNSKFTILIFWDPDCGHCKKEIPELYETYKEIKSLGVEAFAVCTETEMEKWRKFIAEHKLDWINVVDPEQKSGFRNLYDISSTPKIFILNEKKEIIAKQIDAKQCKEIIERATRMEEKK